MSLPAPSAQFYWLLNLIDSLLEDSAMYGNPPPVGMWDGGEGRQSNGKQIFSRDGSKHRCWHGRAGGVAELES